MQKHIYSEEEVKNILLNHGYELISEYKGNIKEKHEYKDFDGYLYNGSIDGIIRDNTKPDKFHKNNIYTIYNINKYIKNNNLKVTK